MDQKSQDREECEICELPEYFEDLYKIGKHKFVKKIKKVSIYYSITYRRCEYCDDSIDEDDLENHIQKVHLGGSYRCRRCWTLKSKPQKSLSPVQKLCETLNIRDEAFKELTDIAFISGDAIAYALDKPLDNYITRWNFVHLFMIINRKRITQKEQTEIINNVVNIFRREMRSIETEDLGFGSKSMGLFRQDVGFNWYTTIVRGYYTLPQINIGFMNTTFTPEELVNKFAENRHKCYYHRGEFWISDKAQEGLDSTTYS